MSGFAPPDFAPLPEPPYYAVIFTAQRAEGDHGYAAMAARMSEMALASPGCIGMESTRDTGGFGITVSYWRDEASILRWKADAQHLKVERHYAGPTGRKPVAD